MKRVFVCLLFLAILKPDALAQIDTPRVRPEFDSRDLFERASSSDYVVVGRIVNVKGVGDRIDRNSKEQILASMDKPLAGEVFQLQVEETICSRQNFEAKQFGRIEAPEPRMLSIFIPAREPVFTGPNRQEVLLRNRRYALFLVAAPPALQKAWTESFELDPKITYYRAEELSRGVIALSPASDPSSKAPPVLEKIQKLCSALRPSSVDQKIANLRELASSDDPDLQREATSAIEALLKKN